MDHLRIEEQNLIDQYVRGTMPADERAEFEEHFVDCAACQEQIEAARSLRLAVRESVAETRAGSGWRWTAIAACACVGIAIAASSVFLFERQSARSELASVRSSLERAPVVFGLSLSRDASEPRDVTIPAEPRWMVFLAEIDATRYSRYRAAVIGSRGHSVRRAPCRDVHLGSVWRAGGRRVDHGRAFSSAAGGRQVASHRNSASRRGRRLRTRGSAPQNNSLSGWDSLASPLTLNPYESPSHR